MCSSPPPLSRLLMGEKDFGQTWTVVDSSESSRHLHTLGLLCSSTLAEPTPRPSKRTKTRKKKKTRRAFEHASARNGPMRQLMVVETWWSRSLFLTPPCTWIWDSGNFTKKGSLNFQVANRLCKYLTNYIEIAFKPLKGSSTSPLRLFKFSGGQWIYLKRVLRSHPADW